MSDIAVKVEGLYKKFCMSLKRSMLYGTYDVARDMLSLPQKNVKLRASEFWALQDINFELKRGETLGLIGQNGCGKTTLLRLINGIFPPDKGKITINGRIGALIAVGAGFHPHMTGRENVYLNGAILGMTKAEIKRKFDEIVDFAEIGEFIDAPVATYSSGMTIRLGFAIAIHCDPDILLVDEILAVGDIGFQAKCSNKIGELRKKGITTIIVSHNLHTINTLSSRIIVMDKGEDIFAGNVEDGLALYQMRSAKISDSSIGLEKVVTGNSNMTISEVSFTPPLINDKITINNLDNLEIAIKYTAYTDLDDIDIGLGGSIPLPVPDILQTTNHTFSKRINIPRGEGVLKLVINNITLNNINLRINMALWEKNREQLILYWRNIPLWVVGNPKSTGWSNFKIEYYLNGKAD